LPHCGEAAIEHQVLRERKKCYNVLDYCCYVSEDDIEITNQEFEKPNLIDENLIRISKKTIPTYDEFILQKIKFQIGDMVYAKNVTSLAPNGIMNKAKNGNYHIIGMDDTKYWLRSNDKNDLNEYFSTDLELKSGSSSTSGSFRTLVESKSEFETIKNPSPLKARIIK
jgi:hypothetical protein